MSDYNDALALLTESLEFQTRERIKLEKALHENRFTWEEVQRGLLNYQKIQNDLPKKRESQPNRFITQPIFRGETRRKLTTADRDRIRDSRRKAIEQDIEKALDNEKNYYSFIEVLGYDPDQVPSFEKVANLTLENDKLCINEIPEDEEENDTKSEAE